MFDGQHRTFQILTSPPSESGQSPITTEIKINETPGLSAENLSLATWGSSYILANKLHKWKDHFTTSISFSKKTTIPILELGAGTSLVGLSAAKIFNPPPPGVIVTDLEPLIAGLEANIAANPSLSSIVMPGILDWWNPTTLLLPSTSPPQKFSSTTHQTPFILAADTVYDPEHPHLLTSTIKAWLSRDASARVIFCYVLRHAYIEIIQDLWKSLEEAGLESIEEGQEDPDPDKWDDVAPFEWCVWRWKESALQEIEKK